MPLRALSHETINKCLALLARILDDAVERGYIADNPARRVRRLRHHRSRRPVLEAHQAQAMFEAADRLDLRASGLTAPVTEVAALRARGLTYPQIARQLDISMSTAHYRQTRYEQAGEPIAFFRVWMRLLCAIGLRIDEACRARRRDVDLIAMCMRVGHAKTAAGVRSVQLTPDTAADLGRYLAMTSARPADGPLLPTTRGTFTNRANVAKRVIEPLVAETNIVLAERRQPALRDGITAHALRKTFFTFLHEAGAPPRWVADQGGHTDPSTSLRIYTESLRGASAATTAKRSTPCSTEPQHPARNLPHARSSPAYASLKTTTRPADDGEIQDCHRRFLSTAERRTPDGPRRTSRLAPRVGAAHLLLLDRPRVPHSPAGSAAPADHAERWSARDRALYCERSSHAKAALCRSLPLALLRCVEGAARSA